MFDVKEKSGTIFAWILRFYYMIYSIKAQVIHIT